MQAILVVDDDLAVRQLLATILQVEGFAVLSAATGAEALAAVVKHTIDLAIIDLGLPDMNGRELSVRLRDLPGGRDLRQMIISGNPPRPDEDLGADAVLSKPFDFTHFVDILTTLMAAPLRAGDAELAAELDRILAGGLITPVFQPIVDLTTGEVVGVEGLARGPEGPLHGALELFDAAHRFGRLHELDLLCRVAVLTAARANGDLVPPLVFVNVEPGIIDLPMSAALEEILATPLPFRTVVEFTERALTRRVPALLRHAEEIRSRGNVVALDDLGAEPSSVAMLPLVQPEIIKMDASLLRPDLSDLEADTAAAVAFYAQRSDARVIAEGIETEEDRQRAIALGAHWGQGWLFSRPGRLESVLAGCQIARRPELANRVRVDIDARRTPFEIALELGAVPVRGTNAFVASLMVNLRAQAARLHGAGLLLAAVRDVSALEDPARPTWSEVAAVTGVVGLVGVDVPDVPWPKVYGTALAPSDPLAGEWACVVFGPHVAVVLSARPAADGAMDYVLSREDILVARVARLLTSRLQPRASLARTTALPPSRPAS